MKKALALPWNRALAGLSFALLTLCPLGGSAAGAPTITVQPQSQAVLAGTNAAFTVAASGQTPFSYRWSRNGINLTNTSHISGATNAMLTISNVAAGDAGNYLVQVSNSHGSTASSNATLTVLFPPSITLQPTNQTVYAGDPVALSVAVDGTLPMGYQWLFNGLNLAGETNPVLLFAATTNRTGSYSVVVTNICGSIQSANAALNVLDSGPVILTQPASQFPNAASDAMLQVGATGSKPLTYQWWRNGGIVPGATNPVLRLSDVSPDQNGNYQVVVSNRLGTVTSSTATLTVQTMVAWGDNRAGACSPPEELLTNVAALAGEYYAGIALRTDGQLLEWVGGFILWPWGGVVALASGGQHSLGVTTDGQVVAWGSNNSGESFPPPGLSNVVAVAGGANHSLALKSDGTLVAWGANNVGQTNIPAGLSNITAIASGDSHNLALRGDGSVAGWGANSSGQVTIPSGLSNVVSIACGVNHSLALKSDGTVVAWGDNSEGQTNVPAGLGDVVSIACGYNHCLALRTNGTVVAWGDDEYGASEAPPGLSNVMSVAAGLAYRCSTIVGKGKPLMLQPPADAEAVAGQSFLFDSPAMGTVPLRYQWRFNGTNLPGATWATLLLTNVGYTQAGIYTLAVSNALGGLESADATLTVLPLKITSQPVSATVAEGTNCSFKVTVVSTQPTSYQWRFNGQDLPGATNSDLIFNNVPAASAGDYVVVAANMYGAVTSVVATLIVIVRPTFVTQPVGQSVPAGQIASFTGIADSTAPLNYQWYFNGAQLADTPRINGSMDSTLTISNLQASDAGDYTLAAANVAGSATSTVAVLDVLIPPAFTQQPQSQTVLAGSNLSLTVSALGEPPPAYQWWFNGVPLADGGRLLGAHSNSLAIALSETNDSGNYSVTASNSLGSATSAVAAVSVVLPVTITSQPANRVVLAGSNATFTVAATGFVPPGYLWFSNGIALANGGRISGVTSATLTIASAQTSDTAAYQVIVTNNYGSATSSMATLTVYAPVRIVGQPSSQAVLLGSNAVFAVSATGTAPLNYQWYFNGTPLTEGGRLSGSASPELNITAVQTGDAGGYRVVVTNLLSSATSLVSSLTPQVSLAPSVRYVNLNNTNPQSPYLDWNSAATNIQDAVDAAVAGDSVVVSNGTYNTGGRAVYGVATNRVVVNKAIAVESVNGPTAATIVGFNTFAPAYRIGRCVYLTNGASLAGFTLASGGASNSGDPILEQSGGGVWCESSSAVISNCIFSANSAPRYGGAAFRGMLFNCILTNNSASYGGGAASNALFNCSLKQNISAFQNLNYGGGACGCTLNNCQLVGNQAIAGGGFGGGATFSKLSNCVISNNSAAYGGGVYFGTANNSLISSNRASTYGGGACSNVLNNCVLTKNQGGRAGGGAYYSTVTNCTVVGNGGAGGGGLNGGAVANSIVYNNTGGNLFDTTNVFYVCTIPAAGRGGITNAPLFVNETNGDFHLQSSSPCINAGNNNYLAATNDFDGNPRIMGGTVDLGAYEFQSPSSIISYAWLQQFGLPADGSADFADSDGDGMNNWAEWRAGTNPTDPSSVLRLLIPPAGSIGITVTWQSAVGISYFVQRSLDLGAQPAFATVQSNVVGQASTTSYTDTNAPGPGPFFYRVGVQ